ncbi:MAG: hypothetical protein WBD26_02115, partial [Candidatus Acidiferrales bacterium]
VGTLTRDSLQFVCAMLWNNRVIIQIVCTSRQSVDGDDCKAADTVKLARLVQEIVKFCEKFAPR